MDLHYGIEILMVFNLYISEEETPCVHLLEGKTITFSESLNFNAMREMYRIQNLKVNFFLKKS